MKRSQLFGTDGIRGVAGEYPLDERTVHLVGRALGKFLNTGEAGKARRVLIGQDTRESSRWIADTLAAGLSRENVSAVSAGVLPTAGVAYLSRLDGYAAGVMISASHNPYQDNGIKVFAHTGYKLPDADELRVEGAIFRLLGQKLQPPALPHSLREDPALRGRYEQFLRSRLRGGARFDGMRVVLDCANGAASSVAPELFEQLGAEVIAIHAAPDGRNINLDCGSLHIAALQEHVRGAQAAVGVAFDGDADRALFTTADGSEVNGDGVMLLAAERMLAEGRLRKRMVVGTIMSNLGLEVALARNAIQLLRTPVGDKYVLEEMLRQGANLGGEQSGHVIFSDDHTTGDGLLTALRVLEAMATTGRPLAELVAGLRPFPQVIRNVRVREKLPIEELPEVWDAIRASQEHFGLAGRVIVRYSGTEKLARVMIEAPDESEVHAQADAIVEALQRAIGV